MKNLVWLGAKFEKVSTTQFKAAYSYKNDTVYINRDVKEDILVHENVHKWQYEVLSLINIDKDVFYNAQQKLPTLVRLHEALAREVQYGQMTLAQSLNIFVRFQTLDKMISWSVKRINKTIDILAEKYGDIRIITIYNHGIAIDTANGGHYAYDLVPYHTGVDIKDRTGFENKFGTPLFKGDISSVKNYFENIRKEVFEMTTTNDQNNNNNTASKEETTMTANKIALFGVKENIRKDGSVSYSFGSTFALHLIGSTEEVGSKKIWESHGNVFVNGELKAEFNVFVYGDNKKAVMAQLNSYFADIYDIGNKIVVDCKDNDIKNNKRTALFNYKGIFGSFTADGSSFQQAGYKKHSESLASDTFKSRVVYTPAKKAEQASKVSKVAAVAPVAETKKTDITVDINKIVSAAIAKVEASAKAEIESLKAEVATLKTEVSSLKEEIATLKVDKAAKADINEEGDKVETPAAEEAAPVNTEKEVVPSPSTNVVTGTEDEEEDDLSPVDCDNDPAMADISKDEPVEESSDISQESEASYKALAEKVIIKPVYDDSNVISKEDYKLYYDKNWNEQIVAFVDGMFSLFKNNTLLAEEKVLAAVNSRPKMRVRKVKFDGVDISFFGVKAGKTGWFKLSLSNNNVVLTFTK